MIAPPATKHMPEAEAARIARDAYSRISVNARQQLGKQLGLGYNTLKALAVGWSEDEQAFTFPMRRGRNSRICGIRLRSAIGQKFSVKGSRAGLFIPSMPKQSTLWICEGPTDTGALHQLGMWCVGRDSCRGGKDDLTDYIARIKPRVVVIVADPDEPGQQGAADLREHLGRGVVITPPAKDVRQWVMDGATQRDLHDLLRRGVAA